MTEGVLYRGGGQWPSFGTITYPGNEWLAGTPAAALVEAGVPTSLVGLSYSATENLEVAELPGRGRLVCFGRSGLSERVCVDLESGVVLQIDRDGTSEHFVNSSLDAFARAVRAVIERFPFYSSESELDEYEEVASELARMIREVDPEGLVGDGFWETFISDVSMGDYATEEIVQDIGNAVMHRIVTENRVGHMHLVAKFE